MNQTDGSLGNSGASLTADTAGIFTSANLIIIALFAALVIAGMIYGAKLKRQRVKADDAVEKHAVAAHVVEAPAPPPPPASEATAPEPIADAPIAAAGPFDANPAMEAASAPGGAPAAPVKDSPAQGSPAQGPVTQLKGLGPKVAARLAELGIATVGQVAALSHDEARALDAELGPFRGRMERDRWIEQARFLAAGDIKGFEAVFGRL